jgi:hypothetical protein
MPTPTATVETAMNANIQSPGPATNNDQAYEKGLAEFIADPMYHTLALAQAHSPIQGRFPEAQLGLGAGIVSPVRMHALPLSGAIEVAHRYPTFAEGDDVDWEKKWKERLASMDEPVGGWGAWLGMLG